MHHYPLNETEPSTLKAASGRGYNEITLEAVAAGEIGASDLAVRDDTLQAQATIAHDAGFKQLAQNLTRAAELTRVPNEELLHMYEALRPGRSSYAELMALSHRLAEEFAAPANAAFVLEAADIYRQRNLLRRP